MQAMILAAGMGKRLGKYTRSCTKCMIRVGNARLIDRMVAALKQAGIHKLIMVVGYEGEQLEAYLRETAKDMELVFIYNRDYQKTNNIYSLFLAKFELEKDDTLLLESDLIFDKNIISEIVKSPYDNMVTVAKYEHWMDGTVVLLDSERHIIDFVAKADFRYEEVEDYYKTVNIYKFSKEFSKKQYIPFLEAYIKAYGVNQYYELVLKILAHVQYSQLKAFVLEGYNWYEIDDVQDLRIAETIFAEDDKQFHAYDNNYGGFWRFPKLRDFCYLVNPYYPPKKMVDHMRYFYETLLREYPSGLQTQNLNAARMFWVDENYILVGNGAAELINVLGEVLEGNLLTVVPVFNEYVRCFKNCTVHRLYSSEVDFNVGSADVLRRIDGMNAVALINPDNPSGSFILQKDMMRIIDECRKKDVLCIIDESFVDFADGDIRYTLLDDDLLQTYTNLLVIKSISKSYGVPGLRLGIAASANTEILQKMRNQMPIWNINSMAEYFLQIHGLYANDYLDACDKIAEERSRMIAELEKLRGLRVYPSQANYIMCCIHGKINAKDVANILVKDYNILIKDLTAKDGVPSEKYIRLAVKNRKENDELIQALKSIL